jgi:hypothetical protein
MLTILLKILSIVGILLLVALGVIVLLLAIVLFVPITYRVRAKRQAVADSEKPLMHADVRVNWLLGLLRARFCYPEPGNFTVKLLFFPLFDSGASKEEAPAQRKSGRQNQRKRTVNSENRSKEAPQKQVQESSQEIPLETVAEPRKAEPEEERTGTARQTDTAGKTDTADKNARDTDARSENLVEKIQYTFHKLYAKIKDVQENIAYYKELLTCDDTKVLFNHVFIRLGKILKSIRPRKLCADIRFGTGSPDTTGYAYGIYGMLCAYLGKHVLLTPDFERAVLEGNLYAAGHITICKLLWHGLPIVFDSRLKELMDKLKKEEREHGK